MIGEVEKALERYLEELAERNDLVVLVGPDHKVAERPSAVAVAPPAWLSPTPEESFIVATDPTLSGLRRTIGAFLKAGLPVTLHGDAGVGKRTLARWAAQEHAPIAVRRYGPGGDEAGALLVYQGCVVEDLHAFGSADLQSLRALLEQRRLVQAARDQMARPGGIRGASGLNSEDRAKASIMTRRLARELGTTSPDMWHMLKAVDDAIFGGQHLLILGERGVGKTMLARQIHELSERRGERFVHADLASVPGALLEAELFGVVRGAATDVASRDGLFKAAGTGTIFLDEVGELPLEAQSRLLRVLQDRRLRQVGAETEIPIEAQIILATNRDLAALVKAGRFRPDLYDRIRGAAVRLPSLRERPGDVLPIARRLFGAEYQRLAGTPAEEDPIDPAAALALESWSWPGNVRELEQTVLAAAAVVARSTGKRLERQHLGALSERQLSLGPLISTTLHRTFPGLSDLTPLEQRSLMGECLPLRSMASRRRENPTCDPVRHALLAALRGRPIRADALEALSRRAWEGDLEELSRVTRALLESSTGVVDLELVRQAMPLLVSEQELTWLRVILQPTYDEQGKLKGATQDFIGRGVVLSRHGSWDDVLTQASNAGDRDLLARIAAVQQLCGEHPPEVLTLSGLSRISRTQALLTRDRDSIAVHTFAGGTLEVWAGPVGAGIRPILRPVEPGMAMLLGRAGIVELHEAGSARAIFHLLVAAGPSAMTTLQGSAWTGAPSASDGGDTVLPPEPVVPEDEKRDVEEPKLRVPAVTGNDINALNTIVFGRYNGNNFKAHLMGGLKPDGLTPGLQQVLRYLRQDENRTQQCCRLYGAGVNEELLKSAARSLDLREDRADILRKLPLPLARLVVEHLECPDHKELLAMVGQRHG